MEHLYKLPIEFQFAESSYELTVNNLYIYHDVNNIPILYDGFCEDIAQDFFKANNLDYKEDSGLHQLEQLNISGM